MWPYPAKSRAFLRLLLLALLAAGPVRAHGADPPAVVLEGQLLDQRQTLLRAIGLKPGHPFDRQQEERVIRYLDALGYKVTVKARSPRPVLALEPHRVIRKIFVKGNWPLFEEEILRRLRFRPGQRLPEGNDLAQAIARQEERMRRFLSREGYFKGSLQISITPSSRPHQVNLEVKVSKGKRYKVGEVVVSRAKRTIQLAGEKSPRVKALSDAEIADLFTHHILFYQRAFNTEQFRKDVEKLAKRYQKAGYPGVRVREDYAVDPSQPPDKAVRIALNIQKRKQIIVRFQGAHEASPRELREVLTFSEEGAYDDYEAVRSAEAIRRLYQSKGYLQVQVSHTREVGAGRDVITFRVREGPFYRIDAIEFLGNKSFSDDRLQKVIRTKTFPLLGYISLGEGGFITLTQLQQDAARLVEFYRGHGFMAAKVQGEIAPDPALLGRPGALAAAVGAGSVADKNELTVRFLIAEGQQNIVEQVEIHGNTLLDDQTLLSQLLLKPGRPFTVQALSSDKARLARIYGENGHPYAQVQAFEELSLDGTKETIQFSVQENAAVRFGPIFIRGNFKTRKSVILSDLGFSPGDRFDLRKIEATEARMRKRQIFNVVRIQLLGTTENRTELPVLVTVEERYDDFGAIELGVGGSTDNLFFGSVAYTNPNLLGFGTSLSLKGEVGLQIQSGNLHYRDPRLLGSTLTLDLESFVRNQLTERLGEVFTLGGTLSFSKELWPHLTGIVRYEFRRINHKEDIYRPSGVDETRQVDVLTQTGGIGPALFYDRRDNPLNPKRGFRLGASLLFASNYLGGWNDFLKLNVSGQAFLPLTEYLSLVFAGRYDHGFPLGDDVTLPKVERFYAGGDTTIRGFEEDRAWTEHVEVPLAPYAAGTLHLIRPRGGNIRLLTNFEIQFMLWRESILLGLPLMGALFFDNGFVTNTFDGFDPADFRHGMGAALRIVTPVGFFSLERAWALDPRVGDPQFIDWLGRTHVNFGFVF